MDLTAPPTRKTWRRLFRFSLRSMLLILLAAALFFGLASNSAQRQKRAVREITANGGWVKYDFQVDNQPIPSGPVWLRKYLGRDYFNRLVNATLVRDTAFVADASALQSIEIIGTGVSEEILASFTKLPALRELHIRNGRLTEAGVNHIANLRRLEVLDLGGTVLEQTSLVSLQDLPNLRELVLSHTKFDDTELRHFRGNQTIESLSLAGCKVTEEGFTIIETMSGLKSLDLSFEEFTVTDFAHLNHLKSRAGLKLNVSGLSYAERKQLGFVSKSEELQREALQQSRKRYLEMITAQREQQFIQKAAQSGQ